MNLLSLLTGIAVIGASVLALEGANQITGGGFYLASVRHLAQESAQSATITESPPALETPQPTEAPILEEEPAQEDSVDPQEIRNTLKDIANLKREIKEVLKKAGKADNQNDVAQLNTLMAEVSRIGQILGSSSNTSVLRDALQDFYDGRHWDEVNKIRAKMELPREIKDINLSLRRLEKISQTKSVQNLGLDIARVQTAIAGMKQTIAIVENHMASGNLEEAQEAMQEFHEGGHPGEIEGTIFRIRDIKQLLKRVKDESVRAEVDKVLQEVVNAFNAGEYRDARETMDEYADDLERLINQFTRKRGYNRQDSSRIRNLQELMIRKLQEKGPPTNAPAPAPVTQ